MLEKTFQPQDIEASIYDKWRNNGAFQSNPQSGAEPYVIMMPPPNVTGSLHVGHALTTTLQDVLTRYHRMLGYDVLWQPGTDHAGIATQMVVEREIEAEGKNRKDFTREEFVDKVWEWKEHSGGTIQRQFERLGASPDWTRERFTMDEGLSKAVLRVFVQLYNEGLIYKDKRLVNWDPKLHTALSDLEVEMIEQKGKLWHVSYPIEGEEARTISVATTRPETILGDTAVAVHPDDERYQDLIGKYVTVPIVNRLVPIIADEHADPEQGSGAVKITPAHDFNDFEVGRRHDLAMINILDASARINDNGPESHQGLGRFEAREKILRELEELECLEAAEDITHTVPYDEKSKKVPLEPFLTDQWYCDAPYLAREALAAVEDGRTRFVPENWTNTYKRWMENIQPWCISRQLWWGHRIPAWYDVDGDVYVAESEEAAYQQARASKGDKVELSQDEDVLDTWFSSGLWPFSTLGWPDETAELQKYYPTSVLVTGFDIIFFWVARMMMMGLHFMHDVPFREVYIHALVRDANGQKMSKSKGNVIDPIDIMDRYGADALRFTLMAMTAQGRDIKLSEDRVEGYRNFATKLWNASRFCEMNECRHDSDFDPARVENVLNRWIVTATADTKARYEKAMAEYKFNDVAETIYHFTWGTFCDWYLELVKPLLYSDNEDEALREECRQTASWVLHQIYIMLNPVMPFVTEALYAQLHAGQSDDLLINAQWPDYPDTMRDPKALEDVNWLITAISEIRSVRADMNVPAGARIDLIIHGANDATKARIESFREMMQRLGRINSITLDDPAPSGAVRAVVDEATFILPIADIVDLNQEYERLKREIEKVEQEIKKFDQKLMNEQFLANAPQAVIDEQRERRDSARATRDKLSNALHQLEAA